MSTLTCNRFPTEYSTEEPYETRKEAEEAAAMTAMMAKFPAHYAEVPTLMKQKGSKASEGTAVPPRVKTPFELAQKARPAKRKAPSEVPAGPSVVPKGTLPTDPKSRLNTGLTILKGTPLTKADTSYTAEEADGSYTATLTVHCFDSPASFTGLAAGTRKLAEQYAAEAALAGFQLQIDAAMPEHEAKKAARLAEHQAKLAAKMG